MNQIIQGDCLTEIRKIPDNSVDTIITDPPYGLSFMGKKWDYDVPSVEVWKECLRVIKPGGTALIFAGSRTQHRMAINIEDAGFEIRDTIMWIYGSGFPKSFNIGKGIDKQLGNERKVIGKKYTGKDFSDEELLKQGSMMQSQRTEERIDIMETKGSSPFEGYGTQLKPAYEPIIVAMKPNDGNFVNNALKWGVAGLNIDAGRIDFRDEEDYNESTAKNQHEDFGTKPMTNNNVYGDYSMIKPKNYTPTGRFPANVIFDEEAGKVLDEQGTTSKGWGKSTNGFAKGDGSIFGIGGVNKQRYDMGGLGASRFFYCAKASKSERNAGLENKEVKVDCDRNPECYSADVPFNRSSNPKKNNHPTVKPLKLMEYLCKITRTPTGGIVLDCFAGSGTTGIACKNTGRNYILIEKEPEYVEIIKARLK